MVWQDGSGVAGWHWCGKMALVWQDGSGVHYKRSLSSSTCAGRAGRGRVILLDEENSVKDKALVHSEEAAGCRAWTAALSPSRWGSVGRAGRGQEPGAGPSGRATSLRYSDARCAVCCTALRGWARTVHPRARSQGAGAVRGAHSACSTERQPSPPQPHTTVGIRQARTLPPALSRACKGPYMLVQFRTCHADTHCTP